MDINWENVRRVIVNDGVWWSRPSKSTIDKITRLIPDAKIIGFGIYQQGTMGIMNTWYFLVESKRFIDPFGQGVGNITTSQLAAENRILKIVPKI